MDKNVAIASEGGEMGVCPLGWWEEFVQQLSSHAVNQTTASWTEEGIN